MVLGTFTTVFAEEAKAEKVEKVVGKENKIQYIIDKKFVEGYGNGDYGYDKNIKRSEITKLLVYANGNKELADKIQGSMQLYTDVDTKHWANGVISVGSTVPSKANNLPMLNGYPDGSFKPENDVTYAELAKMLVVLVKKDLTKDMYDEANAHWASQWMTWAAQLGILDDVTVTDSSAPANRADAFTMVYNALYSMEYFHRTPVGENMGIISQLKNSELTLNQGEKAKTYKITENTVFVLYNQHNTLDVNANVKDAKTHVSTAVKARAISNPEYYYGSLVRVLSNDKGEVTHILELGNPRYLALGHTDTAKWTHTSIEDNVIDTNQRWRGVADATVETSISEELGKTSDYRYGVGAKLNYKNGAAKTISFHQGYFARKPINETGTERYKNNYNYIDEQYQGKDVKLVKEVKLTSATRYYVADVYRNQLTEVKNADEAIRILGNTTASNWFFDVYVGYDGFGNREAHETAGHTNLVGYNEAKVVVFNAVQRDNNGSVTLRVKNETNNVYGITLEDTKGNVIDKNVEAYRNYFPYNFNTRNDSAKLDVITFSLNNALGFEAEMLIDHSKTDKYPIVEITDIQDRALIVRDKWGATAVLYMDSETDVFLEGQIKRGALIQFHTEKDNKLVKDGKVNELNYVDVVSVMPEGKGIVPAGSLQGVVEFNHGNQVAGSVRVVNDVTEYGNQYHKVIVDVDRNLYDGKDYSDRSYFVLDNTEAYRLIKWLQDGHTNTKFRFKVKASRIAEVKDEMYDIEVLVGDTWYKINDKYDYVTLAQVKAMYDQLAAKYNADGSGVTFANYKDAEKDLKAIADKVKELSLEDQAVLDSTPYKPVKDAVEKKVKDATELETELAKVTDADIENLDNTLTNPADVKTAVEGKVNAKVNPNATATATLTDGATVYAPEKPVKAKVTLTSAADATLTAEKEITGNIAK